MAEARSNNADNIYFPWKYTAIIIPDTNKKSGLAKGRSIISLIIIKAFWESRIGNETVLFSIPIQTVMLLHYIIAPSSPGLPFLDQES